jgi:hypothetical protein
MGALRLKTTPSKRFVRPHLQKITRAKWTDSVAQAEELARFASTNPSSYPQFLKKKKKKKRWGPVGGHWGHVLEGGSGSLSPCKVPQTHGNRVKHPWTETSEAISQNKPFPLLR